MIDSDSLGSIYTIGVATGEIYQGVNKIDNMEMFYGCVDEDETWVIGSSLYET